MLLISVLLWNLLLCSLHCRLFNSEARRSLQRVGKHHPEARSGQWILRGKELLRPRHPPAFPHGSQRPPLRKWVETRRPSPSVSPTLLLKTRISAYSFPRKQSSWSHEGGSRVHHRANDMWRWAAEVVMIIEPTNMFLITATCLCDIAGGWQDETWPDGWTAVTKDGKRSAQFEHTLLVTETGCEILTRRLEDNGRAHFLSQM